LNDFMFRGPKAWLTGSALSRPGRADAAAVEWRAALQLVGQRLAETRNDQTDLRWRAMLLATLGEKVKSEQALRVCEQIGNVSPELMVVFGRKAETIPLLAKASNANIMSQRMGTEMGGITSISLRLDPRWDTLHGIPEFDQLVPQVTAEIEVRDR
jgi:hypothetical protein